MLVTGDRVPGTASSIGYSVFTPGTVLPPVRHETEEVAYVVAGAGELRLDDGPVGSARATRSTSPPASGTRSRTPATRTS